ncbi:concanavalin A-like lectin/glucanase domain-containing protein [Dunaliella salina]|uniref:Concanavalin A-like lectin/glucanase domain-containing protein n=1 Tax=Dunaliella salina TaxID=3046 RepID=A0ABQ7G0Q9_DUNSA|nr:concanavalin A-like lectin/glucanase domain-containing protein [Dunaliella salina]|eukprot:KAF5828189.1 concanavalin A-like lectin/glucanase domain-containing protein [Dunaliella salina]
MLDRFASSVVRVTGGTEARFLQAYPTIGVVQATQACPNNVHQVYYEVKILAVGESGIISVGLASTDYPLNRNIGWEKTSYGYHSDDGHSFVSTGYGTPYGPTFTTGDVIGAGIDLGRRKAFFTKNGVRLKTAARNVSAFVVPSVGLRSKGAAVQFNFSGPFCYNAEASSDEEGLEARYWRAHIDRQNARLTHGLKDQVTKLKQQLAQIAPDGAGLDQMSLEELRQVLRTT